MVDGNDQRRHHYGNSSRANRQKGYVHRRSVVAVSVKWISGPVAFPEIRDSTDVDIIVPFLFMRYFFVLKLVFLFC